MGEFSEDFYEFCSGGYGDESGRLITCKFCGKEELFWEETMQGWRLFTFYGDLHECKKHTTTRV